MHQFFSYRTVFPLCFSSLCLQSALVCLQLPVRVISTVNIGINYANVCHGAVVCFQEVMESKVGLLTRRFSHFWSSVYCGSEDLLSAQTLTF